MQTSKEVGQIAEELIVQFTQKSECKTAEDIANALEMLISKSAKAVK